MLQTILEVLYHWLVGQWRKWIFIFCWWLSRIHPTLAMHGVEPFGLRIIIFQRFIPEGPCRRNATKVIDLREIALPESKQSRPIHFTVATYVIMDKGFERLVIVIIPLFRCTIAAGGYNFVRIPVLFLLRNKPTSLEYHDFLSC